MPELNEICLIDPTSSLKPDEAREILGNSPHLTQEQLGPQTGSSTPLSDLQDLRSEASNHGEDVQGGRPSNLDTHGTKHPNRSGSTGGAGEGGGGHASDPPTETTSEEEFARDRAVLTTRHGLREAASQNSSKFKGLKSFFQDLWNDVFIIFARLKKRSDPQPNWLRRILFSKARQHPDETRNERIAREAQAGTLPLRKARKDQVPVTTSDFGKQASEETTPAINSGI